jgi:4-hydroxymandelate oxidase
VDLPEGFAGIGPLDNEPYPTVADIFHAARRQLDPAVWDFLDGGAGDETTLAENRRAFASWTFRPRVLAGMEEANTSTSFLGIPLVMPVLTSPFGADRLFHREGHLAVARANARFGVASIVPEASSFSLEQIAAAAPAAARIFQLHPLGPTEAVVRVIRRAEDAGYLALCLTVDCPTGGWRERNRRNQFAPHASYVAGNYAADPEMIFRQLELHGQKMWSWGDVERVMARTELPFVAKGILTAEDARAAVDAGAAGVLISNHGGRQLDGTPASLDQLGEIAPEIGSVAQIALDSGIRRGSDIVKALALGADVVVIGRAAAMALAADGEDGVYRLHQLLHEETLNVMTLAGRPSIDTLDSSLLAPAARAPR